MTTLHGMVNVHHVRVYSTTFLALYLRKLPKCKVGLGRFYSYDRQGPRQNFLLPETNMSTSKLKATSLISIHISVTKSSPNDCSKAAEEDIGQAGKLPGDTSASNHSHSRHRLTGLMIFQETHGRHKSYRVNLSEK